MFNSKKTITVVDFASATNSVLFGRVLSSFISLASMPRFLIISFKPYKFLMLRPLDSIFVKFDGSLERQVVASNTTPKIEIMAVDLSLTFSIIHFLIDKSCFIVLKFVI